MIIIYPDMTQITERRGTAMYPRQTDVGNVFLDQFPFSSSVCTGLDIQQHVLEAAFLYPDILENRRSF